MWSNDLAYLTGLFAADGCLVNDGRHLNMTSKDTEIIDIVRNIIKIKSEPSVKIGGYGTSAYHLSFSNVSLYDFFIEAGLTPKKSLTILEVKIPKEYYFDFLRGYFDGDGTVYGYWDKRWKSSFMYYVNFCSGSKVFLEWIQATNVLYAGTKGIIKKGVRSYILSYAKTDSLNLYRQMYADADAPKLTRKYNKFVAFLELDPYSEK